MANKPDSTNAPSNACIFNNQLSFAEGQDKPGFRIVGYSGEIIKNHWWWGNLAFDLQGLKFAKSRTPVLEEHFTGSRIGFATKQEIADTVTFEGRFLENDKAVAMANDLKAGFPMEASLYVPPSVVEQVAEGASVQVNGQTLKGPGAVFRKAVIKEVSMCVFGADGNTQSTALADNDNNQVKFNLIQETPIMAEKLTKETFAEQYPDIRTAVFADGKAEGSKAERDRFARLKEACGDDSELLVKCFAENMDTAQAQAARIEKLTAEKADLTKKLSEAKPAGTKADPAVSEFNNQPVAEAATTGSGAAKFDEDKATDAQLKEHFAVTQELQDKFSCADAYVSFVRHSK